MPSASDRARLLVAGASWYGHTLLSEARSFVHRIRMLSRKMNHCCEPIDLGPMFEESPQNDFLYFHRPLHRGLRVGEHATHALLLSPPEKRTHHVLSQPDISCANDTQAELGLTHLGSRGTLARLDVLRSNANSTVGESLGKKMARGTVLNDRMETLLREYS
jgi:hypothetical protein